MRAGKSKLLFVFGTRPEAIKLCPLVSEVRSRPDTFDARICVTAQHREMLDSVLGLFGIIPDYDLDLMSENQLLEDLTGRIISGAADVIGSYRPDCVIVQGDTTTTFAAALAAFYHKVTVAHVEAGLRTRNKAMPFPEEINRRLTSVLADLHFAPTEMARGNLKSEGVNPDDIYLTGNTVIDAINHALNNAERTGAEAYEELKGVDFGRDVILVTCHRRENFGESLRSICLALNDIARANPSIQIVYPVHLNPNVKGPVHEMLGRAPNVLLVPPLGYEAFALLMNNCRFILSDSGGIQEEAPGLGKPVLVMRETTERGEAVESGSIRLVGTDRNNIVRETQVLLDDEQAYRAMSEAPSPYGTGGACRSIADTLEKRLPSHKDGL